MSTRWQHLDGVPIPSRMPAAGIPSDPSPLPPGGPQPPPEEGPGAGEEPRLQRARALYRLRQYQQCVELLEPIYPRPAGTSRLLGLCHGLLQEPEAAFAVLVQAWKEEPEDPLVGASLLSAACLTGEEVDADRVLGPDACGPLAEVGGAWCWERGRSELSLGRYRLAGVSFLRAARLFALGPEETAGERLGAAVVGQVVAMLLAGETAAARSACAACPRRTLLSPATLEFLRGALTAAEELSGLPATDRAEVLQPLAEVVTRARLHVRFYDQVRPVSMHWDGLLR